MLANLSLAALNLHYSNLVNIHDPSYDSLSLVTLVRYRVMHVNVRDVSWTILSLTALGLHRTETVPSHSRPLPLKDLDAS